MPLPDLIFSLQPHKNLTRWGFQVIKEKGELLQASRRSQQEGRARVNILKFPPTGSLTSGWETCIIYTLHIHPARPSENLECNSDIFASSPDIAGSSMTIWQPFHILPEKPKLLILPTQWQKVKRAGDEGKRLKEAIRRTETRTESERQAAKLSR